MTTTSAQTGATDGPEYYLKRLEELREARRALRAQGMRRAKTIVFNLIRKSLRSKVRARSWINDEPVKLKEPAASV